MITLVTGGARSGKSGYAEQLAARTARDVVYVATAQARDAEMAQRIARHRANRPGGWLTVEEPLALGAALRAQARVERCILIDCLTLWLTNLILADHGESSEIASIEPGARYSAERDCFLDALRTATGDIIVVSNEVGMGVVPLGALNRFFVDEAGWLNQAVAACADRVVWMVAGCPLFAKGAP